MAKKKVKDCPGQLDFLDKFKEEVPKKFSPRQVIKRATLVARELGFDTAIEDKIVYLKDKLIKEKVFEARLYALDMVQEALGGNSLIFLHTGLGKTYLEILLAIICFKKNPNKKILFLAPTKPLCRQHKENVAKISNLKVGLITGNTKSKDRLEIWNDNQIIVATPQTIVAELKKRHQIGRKEDLQLVIFDEIHNLTGKYDYAPLANYYSKSKEILMSGFTASPDSKIGKLEELRKNLRVSYKRVITRSFKNPDVLPYIHQKIFKPIFIKREKTKFHKTLKDLLVDQLDVKAKELALFIKLWEVDFDLKGCFYYNVEEEIAGIAMKKFKTLKGELDKYVSGHPDADLGYDMMVTWSIIMKIAFSIKSLNKGLEELRVFLESTYYAQQKNKSTRIFLRADRIKTVIKLLYRNYLWSKRGPEEEKKFGQMKSEKKVQFSNLIFDDPKLKKIKQIVNGCKKHQIIIFTSHRSTLRKTVSYLQQEFPELKIDKLIGQSSNYQDPGMSQKEQEKVLKKYKRHEIDILVSTSIGEQGLDFPAVDVVIFYEPISDVRRGIQRMGRTARYKKGVIFLLSYDSGEEKKIYFIFRRREKEVEKIIEYFEKIKGHI